MYTHSQLVDSMVAELLRPDLRAAMSNGLNQTIRELHSDSTNPQKPPITYASNLTEELLTADADSGFTYDLPRPQRFQIVEAVFYGAFNRYASERKPSSIRQYMDGIGGQEYGFYRTGNAIAFDNYGGNAAQIMLAYYEYVQRQTYYEAGKRPCEWDSETETFVFNNVDGTDYNSSPAMQQKALDLCTNWMIQRHWDMLAQGLRAKVWTRLGDDSRSKTAYSGFEAFRPSMIAAETTQVSPRYRS